MLVTHAYISNSSWANDRTGDTAWVTYAGVSNGGHALALSSSAPETSTLTLTFDVDAGYRMNVNSFSFYNRSSYTGYQNWSMTINGIPVSPSPASGADTIYVDVSGGSHVMRSTGTLPVASPVKGLEGKVTIELTLSNRTGNQGTFRIDNFVLNGSIESVGGDVYTSVGGRYRYGFNGKENDNEVKGEGNEIDFGARIYDPRVGRFLSVDPLINKFPWQSPYTFAGNNPIWMVDEDGLAPIPVDEKKKGFFAKIGTPLVNALTTKDIPLKNAMFVLGQVIIEQGYSPQSSDAKKMWEGNAIFNIKGKGTAGSVAITTTEFKQGKKITIVDNFRAYNTMNEAINDYLGQLQKNFPDAYQNLVNLAGSAEGFAKGLQNGKLGSYATAPDYEDQIVAFSGYATKGYNKFGNGKLEVSTKQKGELKDEKIYGTIMLNEYAVTAKAPNRPETLAIKQATIAQPSIELVNDGLNKVK
ncbi:glucosaminidase domain-containing protein [Chitinophaga sp. 30R24]|uniref:RHS repeat-associated core domain-containing protein n=1 Tax=Chitinophaga sp. 30R24 TaxID=3248838 RepID=UPI003B90A550